MQTTRLIGALRTQTAKLKIFGGLRMLRVVECTLVWKVAGDI